MSSPDAKVPSEEAREDGSAYGEAEEEGGKTQERTNKKPRYNDKAFGDLSVNELESAVREANALRSQCAKKQAELDTLKDVKAEKSEVLQRVKALEKELAATQVEVNKYKHSVKEKQCDVEKQIKNVKQAMLKTFKDQMHYEAALKDQLKAGGREIVAYVPNVADAVLKGLKIEPGQQNAHGKYSNKFFGEQVTKSSNGGKLVLAWDLRVTYIKSTEELQVHAKYCLEGAKKPPKKRKAAALEGVDADGDVQEDDESPDTPLDEEPVVDAATAQDVD